MQREELELQRQELKDTRAEFKQQNDTMKRQRFKNTFFGLLEVMEAVRQSLGGNGFQVMMNSALALIIICYKLL